MKKIETELFTSINNLGAIHAYQAFIRKNQQIEIISVNITRNDFVLLTYKE